MAKRRIADNINEAASQFIRNGVPRSYAMPGKRSAGNGMMLLLTDIGRAGVLLFFKHFDSQTMRSGGSRLTLVGRNE